MNSRSGPRPTARWLAPLLFLALVVAILHVYAPTHMGVVEKDSGIFLYTGEQILRGAIPYRDLWDHKPPAIYYINALGLVLGGGAARGVWLLEVASLYAAAMLGFVLLKRAFGLVPSIFGSALWLGSMGFVLQGGNFTEEFALPLQFAALYLFWEAEQRDAYRWRGVLIGLTLAGCFLLRQNLIGVHLAIFAYLVLSRLTSRRWRSLSLALAAILSGAASVLLVVAAYFAAHGALADLWDAVFRYNFAYSAHNPLTQRVMSVFVGWYVLFPSGIMLFAVVGWIGGVLFTLRNRERLGAGKALVYASLIALPAEWALTATSGFLFEHYFTTWLPVCAVLSGLFAHALMTSDRIRKVHNGVWVFAARALASAVPASKWISAARSQDYARDQAVVAYIVNTTSQDDEVLMWGAATAFNFTTGRRSPTRFHYQYPLYTAGYQNAAMIEQFLDDIRRSQPKLIIDTTPVIGVIPSLEPSRRQTWEPSPTYQALPEMERVYAYVESNYRLIGTVGWAQWPVYVRNGVDDTRFRRELSIP